LVATREEALGDFELKKDSIAKVFGDIPHGATNNPVGQTNGKLNIKDMLRSFPVPTEKDRSPNSVPPVLELPK
jgi:hypothetical protein